MLPDPEKQKYCREAEDPELLVDRRRHRFRNEIEWRRQKRQYVIEAVRNCRYQSRQAGADRAGRRPKPTVSDGPKQGTHRQIGERKARDDSQARARRWAAALSGAKLVLNGG